MSTGARGMTDTGHTKRFRVLAVIKYHRVIGEFTAETAQEATAQARDSDMWDRISEHEIGGIYDTKVEELLPDEDVSK